MTFPARGPYEVVCGPEVAAVCRNLLIHLACECVRRDAAALSDTLRNARAAQIVTTIKDGSVVDSGQGYSPLSVCSPRASLSLVECNAPLNMVHWLSYAGRCGILETGRLLSAKLLDFSVSYPMKLDKSNARVRRMFGEIAPRYDLMNHLLSLNVDRYWRWRTVNLAPPRDGSPILDVCTGTGDLALAYSRRTVGATTVVGTDFCPEMLRIGQKKQTRAGLDGQVTFIEADTQQLPSEADHFQLVTVAFGLRNVSDTDQGLAEMVRVCQPGGRVAVLEFSMPRWQPCKGIYSFYFRRVLPKVGQWLARNRQEAYSYLPDSVSQFPSGDALAARMTAAGLEQIRMVPFTLGIATLYLGTKPESEANEDSTTFESRQDSAP